MVRHIIALALVLCVGSAAGVATQNAGPTLTGKWSGSIMIPTEARRERRSLLATFEQNGSELTGTVGPSAEAQLPISKGQVETTQFGTVIRFEMAGPGFVMRFELTPAAGVLRGVARLDGEKATAPVELQLLK